MNPVNLTETNEILTGNDGIVIKKFLAGKDGGSSLDVAGWPAATIPAGHPVIKQTSNGKLKPLPLTGSAPNYTLGALPAGHTYYGVVRGTVLTKRPIVGIMLIGVVNDAAMVYGGNAAKIAELATGMPHLLFDAN